MIRGRTMYSGDSRSDEDGYYKLLVAVVHRAVLDTHLQPDKYKRQWDRCKAAEDKESAEQFLSLAQQMNS
jgi:hypothetical protein